MTNHNGTIICEYRQYLEKPLIAYPYDVSSSSSFLIGVFNVHTVVNYDSRNLNSFTFLGNSKSIICDNKVYVSSELFSYDFIAEDIIEEVTISNRDDFQHTLLSYSFQNGYGCSLDTVTELPLIIHPESSKTIFLHVHKEGDPFQNATLFLFFDIRTVIIKIKGVRIIGFPYDLSENIKIDYKFNTIIFDSDKFYEQRRPLQLTWERVFNGDTLLDSEDVFSFLDFLKVNAHRILGVPIFTEPMYFSNNDLFGISNITFEHNVNNFINLSCSQYCIAIDFDSRQIEIKEIFGYGINTLTVLSPFTLHFYKKTSAIYPILISFIKEKSVESVTGHLIKVSLTFNEVLHT